MHDLGWQKGLHWARPCRAGGMRLFCMGLVVSGILPLAVPARAQSPRGTAAAPWSLTDAVETALASHPSMQAARAGQEVAHSEVGVAKAQWFPHLGLSASATRFEKPMLVHPIHAFTPEDIPPFSRSIYTGTVGLDFALYDGGGRGNRIREARARESSAGAHARATAQDLIQRVVFTYLNVLGQQQLLEAHERRLEALRAESARVQQVLDTGRAARVDLLRAEAELHRAEAERVERATALERSERELARLLGSSETSIPVQRLLPVSLSDSLVPPRDSLVAAARQSNAELQQALADVETSRARSRLSRAQRWPELDLFARGQAWSDAAGHDTAEWNAGVQLAYPLFTGGSRRHRIAAADAAVRDAEARLQILQLEIERRVDSARSDAEEARARARSLRSAVARFSEVRRIRLLTLDTGTGTQTDYLEAEADLLDAQARLIEARYREIASRSALAWHTGQLDLGWLRRNLENR